jgi:hypothetical protein
MAGFASNSVLDASLDKIATANLMTVCSALPTTRTEAVTTYKLADVAVSSGDFTKADGTTGRKLTVAQKTGVAVDASDDATHVALVDDSELLYATEGTTQTLTSGNTMTINSWVINQPDPVILT